MSRDDDTNYHRRRATQELNLALQAEHPAAAAAHLALFQSHSERCRVLEGWASDDVPTQEAGRERYHYCL